MQSRSLPEKHKLTQILEKMGEIYATKPALDSPTTVTDIEEIEDLSAFTPLLPSTTSLQKSHGLSTIVSMAIFIAAAISAADFIFGASKAIERYPFGQIEFCRDNVIVSSVWTNFFFNWMAYLDLFEYDEKLGNLHKAFALFAGVATIAPYFFIGFVGAFWQKIVVAISTLFNLPVFYFGALDFYDYFHVDFVQQWRWIVRCLLTCSFENYRLASKKSAVVFNMKENYKYFSFANKAKRTQFIKEFLGKSDDEKLEFLVDQCGDFRVKRSWLRWFFCAGSGPVVGTAVLAQNIGHVVLTVAGVLGLKWIPEDLRWPVAVLFGLGNFVPSLGYSFATMANFDLIDFVRTLLFLDVPQLQRVIEKDSWNATIAMRVALFTFRYLYITSGFGNDEVNEEGAVMLGASKQVAQLAGIDANVSGAVVFNGVLNEKLFRIIVGWIVAFLEVVNVKDKTYIRRAVEYVFGCLNKADAEDLAQLEFEKMYRELLAVVMKLPLQQDIKSFQKSDDSQLSAFGERFFSDVPPISSYRRNTSPAVQALLKEEENESCCRWW